MSSAVLEATEAKPWRLGARTRKAVLVLHLASVGSWLGIDVVMAVLTFTAMGTSDDSTKALCFRVLERVTIWPMTISGLADRGEANDLDVPLGDMIYPPIVSPTLLMVAVVLSVFKPWGLLRRK